MLCSSACCIGRFGEQRGKPHAVNSRSNPSIPVPVDPFALPDDPALLAVDERAELTRPADCSPSHRSHARRSGPGLSLTDRPPQRHQRLSPDRCRPCSKRDARSQLASRPVIPAAIVQKCIRPEPTSASPVISRCPRTIKMRTIKPAANQSLPPTMPGRRTPTFPQYLPNLRNAHRVPGPESCDYPLCGEFRMPLPYRAYADRAEVRRSSSHSNCRCAAQSGRGGDPAATAVAIAALGARAPANAMPDACHPCDRCAPPAPYLPGWSAPSTAPTVLLRCYPAQHPVCDEGYR